METEFLDFGNNDGRSGFRLWRFEVFNWGTFDSHVWKMEPDGNNALLTGDIGSGKSTLVDAITTILVPSHHITYNQAAGATARERTLGSYVRGAYKTEKDQAQFSAKPVFLRKEGNYSVLLAYFFNDGYQTCVTLAQVFWVKEGKSNPERFYVVADGALSIAEDFTGFKNMTELKKRLRKDPQVFVFESFAQYCTEFRRKMGVQSEQALDLFYKTVSMKSVGNLTEFVRDHMLEEPPVKDRIEDMCQHFENLNRAHESVCKAKDQIHLLGPLVTECDLFREVQRHSNELRQCRDVLHPYFASQKLVLLEERINSKEIDLRKIIDRLNQEKESLANLQTQGESLRQSIMESGGGRLEAIKQEVERCEVEKRRRSSKEEDYIVYCKALGFSMTVNIDAFHGNRIKAQEMQAHLETERQVKHDEKVDIQVAFQKIKEVASALAGEIRSLRSRQSNIPLHVLKIREQLCQTLAIKEAELPFTGELLQVRVNATRFEGAIERLLHNFGLSLLVSEALYSQVARYVEATHLGGRLVYFRVREEKRPSSEETADTRLLIHKIAIKPETIFHDWIEQELIRNFNYMCCDTLDDFQRETKAITVQGQTKSHGRRYEKDDRYRLDDRSRYVLGWNNQFKIKALEDEGRQLAVKMAELTANLTRLDKHINGLENSRDKARDLLGIQSFQDIDWRSVALQIADLEKERKRLLGNSDILRTLQTSLAALEEKISNLKEVCERRLQERAVLEHVLTKTRLEKQENLEEISRMDAIKKLTIFPAIDQMRKGALGDKILTVENCDKSQTAMREWLQVQLDQEDRKEKKLVEIISQKMMEFKSKYPLETQEVDARVGAADEFLAIFRRLQSEDLPRHEENFRRLLNEGTINDIALFQNQLDKERQDIKDKVEIINKSLREIEYNLGTYIKIVSDPARDVEVREFQQDLKVCLGGSLVAATEDLYTERKFLEVKKILDRFNGRVGLADLDRKWTQKVTDVRHWFEFSVSERWKETEEEREFYSDSSGKSGGQKEKLAYTILASALAYQFGLEWGATRSRSLRFVMIDEAFGRGSDESARYGLELFKKLNLQLLIVTPLQKIHVIEDYVRSVHFVHNENGERSKLRNISIEVYREEKKRHHS